MNCKLLCLWVVLYVSVIPGVSVVMWEWCLVCLNLKNIYIYIYFHNNNNNFIFHNFLIQVHLKEHTFFTYFIFARVNPPCSISCRAGVNVSYERHHHVSYFVFHGNDPQGLQSDSPSALTVCRSAHSQGELTFECVTRGRSGCLHLVCVWITGPSRGWELCLVLGTSDWKARQEAKHWFLIDTLNSQTDCTTSGHEQNSMHNSVPQASREALSLSIISLSLF